MQTKIAVAGILLLCSGIFMFLGSAVLGMSVGAAGLSAALVAGNGADPFALGTLGAFSVIGLVLVIFATVGAGIACLAGVRAMNGDPRMLRSGSLMAAGISGLCLTTSCASCIFSVVGSLPLVFGLIALGLASEIPRDFDPGGTDP